MSGSLDSGVCILPRRPRMFSGCWRRTARETAARARTSYTRPPQEHLPPEVQSDIRDEHTPSDRSAPLDPPPQVDGSAQSGPQCEKKRSCIQPPGLPAKDEPRSERESESGEGIRDPTIPLCHPGAPSPCSEEHHKYGLRSESECGEGNHRCVLTGHSYPRECRLARRNPQSHLTVCVTGAGAGMDSA